MSGEQQAKHLARLKRQNPLWSIQPVTGGDGWTAQRDKHPNLWARTLDDLEARLADLRRGSGSSC
jgi:hypothetical protein